jgi:hypothetical protein
MPATILDDVVFPDELVAVAARGRKRWATAIATNQGGFETRNGLRTQPLREYEIGMVPRTVAPGWRWTPCTTSCRALCTASCCATPPTTPAPPPMA